MVEAPSKYSTFDTLEQCWLFIPAKHKECYLVYLLSEMSGSTSMVFTRTCETTWLLALILRNLGLKVISISGQMSHDYILWVGRTARAGAISLVNQYELHDFFQIEKLIGKILPVILLEEEREKVLLLSKRITEAKISYLMKNKVRRGEERWKPMDMEQCVGGRM
ncbi:hypothetical protein MRB53_020715 [Persea americana]|uniref:Uncharacterized protein n=1 Tax=Persea americana TaxID=3435 RepID=A0ACC2L201_PERAE|nr:hypothetical protein MRB53_020715 [Persea americana]